ncbi:hypothetical protein DY000_02014054 [Brassica cretica]|uniref:Uncharacterized protein n=1 Tax=Brassica cretica TaxID=69181 RepID=A0ABQ7DCC5_BRACR|nr:hypothetical protein DY000_02014054 [Brassica cretica]
MLASSSTTSSSPSVSAVFRRVNVLRQPPPYKRSQNHLFVSLSVLKLDVIDSNTKFDRVRVPKAFVDQNSKRLKKENLSRKKKKEQLSSRFVEITSTLYSFEKGKQQLPKRFTYEFHSGSQGFAGPGEEGCSDVLPRVIEEEDCVALTPYPTVSDETSPEPTRPAETGDVQMLCTSVGREAAQYTPLFSNEYNMPYPPPIYPHSRTDFTQPGVREAEESYTNTICLSDTGTSFPREQWQYLNS